MSKATLGKDIPMSKSRRLVLSGLAGLAALTLLCSLALGPAAAAESLAQLHASGAVGERFDGFAVARDAAYAGYVKDVNAQRGQVYKKAAAKNNADAKEVGKVYAQTIMKKAPKGTWLLGPNNKWKQK